MMLLGGAVMVCQAFEKAFVVVARTAFKNPEAMSMSEITSLTGVSFKQPVRALLKELTAADQINENLADRIGTLIDDRNMLVHNIVFGEELLNQKTAARDVLRQMAELGDNWSEDEKKTAIDHAALIFLSKKVARESAILSAELLGMFASYLERFPEAKEFAARNKIEVASLLADFRQFPVPR
jgi:predicted oxidoreductase